MAENTNTEREALEAYLKDCDKCQIVPDVGGAWHAAFQAGRASLSLPAARQEPVFWVRLCGDGLYEGPIHNARIEEVRRQSGAWSPLYLGAAPQPAVAAGREQIAEAALRKVLAAVQRYLPPDGPEAKDTLSEIIEIVDPWPLGPLEKS